MQPPILATKWRGDAAAARQAALARITSSAHMTRPVTAAPWRRGYMTVTLADIEAKDGDQPSVILDIETVWLRGEDVLPITQVIAKIDDLKNRVSVVFESYITDAARESFDAD